MKILKRGRHNVNIVEAYKCSYTCSETQNKKFNAASGDKCNK